MISLNSHKLQVQLALNDTHSWFTLTTIATKANTLFLAVVDVLHILHGVFVHGQQGGGLKDTHKKKQHFDELHILHIIYVLNFYPFTFTVLF